MDPRRTPQRIGLAHLADQGADIRVNRRAAAPTQAGAPTPVEPETTSMPMNDGRRLDQNHRLETARPEAVEPDPEQAVAGAKTQPAGALAPEHAQLMAEGDDLQFQRGSATKAEGQQADTNAIMPATLRESTPQRHVLYELLILRQGQNSIQRNQSA